MAVVSKFRKKLDKVSSRFYEIRKVFFKPPGLLYRFRLYQTYRRIARGWLSDFGLRVQDVKSAGDNEAIACVPNAGKIIDGKLVMHNGTRINPGSYVGDKMTRLLQENHGIHEPQEEAVFATVLSWLEERRENSYTMVELGSYWAFYSLWFKTILPNSQCFCVEPEQNNLDWGQKNFELNSQYADFTRAFVGPTPRSGDPEIISVDSFVERKKIKHIHILHSDIQGHELDMLCGAENSFKEKLVDYIFISTHRHLLHYRCLEKLETVGFRILADADLLESHSLDGLIVAARNDLKTPAKILIHHRIPK